MVRRIKTMLIHLSRLTASLAFILALYSVNQTCLFMMYQPDVPEELR